MVFSLPLLFFSAFLLALGCNLIKYKTTLITVMPPYLGVAAIGLGLTITSIVLVLLNWVDVLEILR